MKKHLCKILLALLQVAFLGAGPVYIKEFANLVNEMQEVKREMLVKVAELQKTGEGIKKVGKDVDKSVKELDGTVSKVSRELDKVKKACKRFL